MDQQVELASQAHEVLVRVGVLPDHQEARHPLHPRPLRQDIEEENSGRLVARVITDSDNRDRLASRFESGHHVVDDRLVFRVRSEEQVGAKVV